MKQLIVLLFAFFSTAACADTSTRLTIQQIIENDRWSVAEGTHQGKPLVIRYRGELSKKPDLRGFPRMVRIVWPYAANASGMPDSAASVNMGVFEDRLMDAVEPGQNAILVAVLTNGGQREWLFYTASVAEFGKRLTAMPQEKDRYPIELSSESDPEWSAFYDNILPGIAHRNAD